MKEINLFEFIFRLALTGWSSDFRSVSVSSGLWNIIGLEGVSFYVL